MPIISKLVSDYFSESEDISPIDPNFLSDYIQKEYPEVMPYEELAGLYAISSNEWLSNAMELDETEEGTAEHDKISHLCDTWYVLNNKLRERVADVAADTADTGDDPIYSLMNRYGYSSDGGWWFRE